MQKTVLIYQVTPEELTLHRTICNLEGWPNRIQLVNTGVFTSSSPYQYLKDMEQMLVVGCEKKVCFYDNKQYELLEVCEGHKDSIQEMLYDPECQLVYTAGYDKLIIVWDVEEIVGKIVSNYSMYREDI